MVHTIAASIDREDDLYVVQFCVLVCGLNTSAMAQYNASVQVFRIVNQISTSL